MKLIIDIPEKDWKFMRETYKGTGFSFVLSAIKNECVNAVYNGKPLPKGHGRIGDLDAFIDEYRYCFLNDIADEPFPTLVEADKEVDE